MSFVQSFVLAIKSLLTGKMRAFLTMLGIIIGVGAVIVIISLGDGMNSMMTDSFESMGTNLLMVQLFAPGPSRSVTDDEMYSLTEKYPDSIAYVSPSVTVYNNTVKYGTESDYSTVTGVGEHYDLIKNLDIADGRFIQYIDITHLNNVCVVGSYVEKEVLGGNAVGKKLYINGCAYTVVGTLEEKADSTQRSDDDAIYIPYTNATRLIKNADISFYYISSTSDSTSATARWAIETELYKVYQDEDYYQVVNMAEMLDMFNDLQGTLMTVLVAIAGISLLVGGIGIMNIMLVSVTERTREIGIRKSLGAKRRDIRLQFIIEAGTTSAVGGIIGIVAGVTLAGLVGNLIGITAVPSVSAILVSFGVSVGVGIIFGYLPANKAAKLNPIDALRYD